ncbi:MAG: ribbon-helix-helix protein, CopG family [Deltaproteobacteria bacterium]|nr:ribbon-helix-helix protein, CopG family [Deltaproteobacteria bacterium]
MNRTSLMLPPELKARASRRAQQLGISLGELVRQALTEYLRPAPTSEPSDPLLDDDAVFEGDAPADVAANHDRYLYGDS